jgi:hypothetical protein
MQFGPRVAAKHPKNGRNLMTRDLYAEVVLRSQSGASLLNAAGTITPERLHLFQAREDAPAEAAEILEREGYRVFARSRFGISIAGPRDLFERYFATRVLERPFRTFAAGRPIEVPALVAEVAPVPPDHLSPMTESVYIPKPGHFDAGEGAMPTPCYYALRPPDDIVGHLNAAGAHGRGFRGNGVRVAMVDSGFIADHDYYRGRGYRTTVHADIGRADRDEAGHGTAVAANLLAIAPACDFHFFKVSDGQQWTKTGAFRQAVASGARVITNSWRVDPPEPVLEAEIVSAFVAGITVIFSGGNEGPVSWPACLPYVLAVGGAFPHRDGTWEASNFASSGTHPAFPGRHVPDLVAIAGPEGDLHRDADDDELGLRSGS